MGLSDIRPTEDGWQQLDKKVVEISTWLATAFGCGILAIGVVNNQADLAVLALNPFSIAIAGWLMLALQRPNVLLQLTVGLTALLITTAASDLSQAHDPLLAVLAMTVVGVLFSRRRTLPFVAVATVLVAMVAYLHEASMPIEDRLQSALGAAMTVAFIAWLVSWVKTRWLE
ncbi:MAG: hypothetical protein HKN91_08695, partial [Acidimicrobiia bacterium]|nr:hypothetical protein [Acidimicrobiia bacterium]